MAKTTEEANSAAGHNSPGPRTPMQPQSWLSGTFPRPLQFLHSLLFSTIATYVSAISLEFAKRRTSSTRDAWSQSHSSRFLLADPARRGD